MDLSFAVYLVAIALVQWHRRRRGKVAALSLLLVFWTVAMLCLHTIAFLLVNGNDMGLQGYATLVVRTAGHSLRLSHLSPSLSILWYTQMQLFGRFATYFQITFASLPFMLVAPTAIRLYRYPMVLVSFLSRTRLCAFGMSSTHAYLTYNVRNCHALEQVAIYWFVWTLFRPTSTLYDLNVGLCFMLMSPRSLARMNVPVCLIATCALMVPVTLYVVLYWMWLETGNGEANFLYFQCYAYNVFAAILFIQFAGASVERDKAVRLTLKEQQNKWNQKIKKT